MEPYFLHLFTSPRLQGQEGDILYHLRVATGVCVAIVGGSLDCTPAADAYRARSKYHHRSRQRCGWALLAVRTHADARKLVALQEAALASSVFRIEDFADPMPEDTFEAEINVIRHATEPHRRWTRDEIPRAKDLYDELATVATPAYLVFYPLCIDPYDPWDAETEIDPEDAHSWSAFVVYRTRTGMWQAVSAFGTLLGGYIV